MRELQCGGEPWRDSVEERSGADLVDGGEESLKKTGDAETKSGRRNPSQEGSFFRRGR